MSLRTLAPLLLAAAAVAAEPFPWVMPLDGGDGVVDLSPGAPAGPVEVRDGRFVRAADGQRVRFLGVALTFAAAFPEPEVAVALARRLARLGINAVRIHYIDGGTAGRFGRHSIWDPAFPREPRLDPAQLARLDRLIHELGRQGVHVNLNLKVARAFGEADGLPAGYCGEGADKRITKGMDLADPRLIALQEDYARALLGHVSPHSGRPLGQDPALMAVELNNENSLVMPNRPIDEAAGWPEGPAAALRAAWNRWLAGRYRDQEALAAAWSAGGDLGAELPVERAWTLERHQGASATSAATADGIAFELPAPPAAAWHVQAVLPMADQPAGTRLTFALRVRADRERPLTLRTEMGAPPWSNRGLDTTVPVGRDWRELRLPWIASDGGAPLRLVVRLGAAAGRVELAGLRLLSGHAPPAPPAAGALAAGTVPIPVAPLGVQRDDWLRFLVATEQAFAARLTACVRGLGVRAPVVCGQASWGPVTGLHRELAAGYIDDHQYWDHPAQGWRDPRTLRTHGRPLAPALAEAGPLADLARYRVAGMPFSVSEFDHCAPNPHRAEGLPIVAAVAALQDWDALVLHEYGSPPAPLAQIYQPFEVGSDPAVMAFLPAAALAFRDGALGALARCERRPLAGDYDPARGGRPAEAAWPLAEAGARLLSARIGLDAGRAAPDWLGGTGWSAPGSTRVQHRDGVFACRGERVAILAGALGGTRTPLTGTRTMPATLALAANPCTRNHGALAVVALDGRPLERSRRMLVTAMAGSANTGMKRKPDGSGIEDWGTAPVLVEPLTGALDLPLPQPCVPGLSAWALDPGGALRAPARLEDNRLLLLAEDRTVWYLVAERP